MRMAPHKSCCGCCCKLEIGAPVGVVLLLLLYLLQAVLSSIGAANATPASYQLDAVKAFCLKTTGQYRQGYKDCYGSSVCYDTHHLADDAMDRQDDRCPNLTLTLALTRTPTLTLTRTLALTASTRSRRRPTRCSSLADG